VKRGELYLVKKPGSRDPRKQRVFVVVSRQALIDSRFSSVICAPVYSQHDGLSTQVCVGLEQGLKKESSIHCDELVSLPKAVLTHYVGCLGPTCLGQLEGALAGALGLDSLDPFDLTPQ
jgi:mRNA interferase MazF